MHQHTRCEHECVYAERGMYVLQENAKLEARLRNMTLLLAERSTQVCSWLPIAPRSAWYSCHSLTVPQQETLRDELRLLITKLVHSPTRNVHVYVVGWRASKLMLVGTGEQRRPGNAH